MCICKQHVPVICTCTNIMFFFKIGVKIKAIFKDSGSLCAYSYLYQDSLPPDIAAFIIYKVIILKLINLSIGEVGGGATERYGELHFLFFYFFFAHGEQFINRTRILECTCHLILGASWPFDLWYHLPRTPDSLR